MDTLSAKFFSFLFLTMFGGGWTVPLGVPPAKEEPALARIAPEKCVFYASWAGMAAADPRSKNQTEQLLAEPEVQRACDAFATLASNVVRPDLTNNGPVAPKIAPVVPGQSRGEDDAGPDAASIEQIAWQFAMFAATHPAAVFVTEIKSDDREGRGGLLVAAGKDADKLRGTLDKFRKLAKDTDSRVFKEVQIAGHTWYRITAAGLDKLPITCGFQDTDFILGAGDGTVEEILQRRQHEPPAWLTKLQKRLPLERVSTIVHLDVKMLLDQAAAKSPLPKTREAMRRLGLDNLAAVSSVSGLDGETFTSKLLLSTDGAPRGLLTLFSDQPLSADDFNSIPADSTLSLAARFDVEKAIEQFAEITKPRSPGQPAPQSAIDQVIDSIAKAAQVNFRRELPKAIGDRCCIYSSPSEGGLVTAVFSVKDRRPLSAIQLKLAASSMAGTLLSGLTQDAGLGGRRPPQLHSFRFADESIFYFDLEVTFSAGLFPAWCITDRELVLALTPQNIMAYLQRDRQRKSLAAVPQVGRLVGSSGPSVLAHIDTMRVFELIYPVVPLYASLGSRSLGQERAIPLDAFPSFPAIRRHLVPGTAALRRTADGLELTSRQPLPGTGLLWTAALMAQSPQTLEQQVAAEDLPRADNDPLRGQPGAPTAPVMPPLQTAPPRPATAPWTPEFAPYSPTTTASATPSTMTTVPAALGSAPQPPSQQPATLGSGAAPNASYTVSATGAPLASPASALSAGIQDRWYARRNIELYVLGRGFIAYRAKQGALPPAYLADEQGKPLLSWRVALLPYLNEQDLYKQFHLDEPWDSPHNKELISRIPEVFLDPDFAYNSSDTPAQGKTRFLLLRGVNTVYADRAPSMPRTYEEWLKVIALDVRRERAVTWTKPEDFTYDPKNPHAGMGGEKSEVDLILTACGKVYQDFRPLAADKSPAAEKRNNERLRALFTGEGLTDDPPLGGASPPFPNFQDRAPLPVPHPTAP